jgi:hypothetical protein
MARKIGSLTSSIGASITGLLAMIAAYSANAFLVPDPDIFNNSTLCLTCF